MSAKAKLDRRGFLTRGLAIAGAALAGGCDSELSEQPWVKRILDKAETLTYASQRALIPANALAREYSEADISRDFKANGSTGVDDDAYRALAANGFADWKHKVGGLVETRLELSLAELRAMPARTQITRHDCVEGWSCIGKWTGVPLKASSTKQGSSRQRGMSCSIAPTISPRPAMTTANIMSRSGSRTRSTLRPSSPMT